MIGEKRIVYTAHAKAVLAERELQESWVEWTLADPDWVEDDPEENGVTRRFRALPERGGRHLRVVCVETSSEIRIISVFLDRGARPK